MSDAAVEKARQIAQRLALADDESSRAWRKMVADLSNAWKHKGQVGAEFEHALHLALVIGVTKPLRDYVASGKPVPQERVSVKWSMAPQDMALLVDELLGRCHPQQQERTRGRPRRIPGKERAVEQAEHGAAFLVAWEQKQWRKRTGGKRMLRTETDKFIDAAIAEASDAFKVPAATISACKVRDLLKNMRNKLP